MLGKWKSRRGRERQQFQRVVCGVFRTESWSSEGLKSKPNLDKSPGLANQQKYQVKSVIHIYNMPLGLQDRIWSSERTQPIDEID